MRKSSGVRMVVKITTPTTAEKISDWIKPSEIPTAATIRPTSPRDIMPTPSCSDSRQEKPPMRPPQPAPTTLPMMATIVIAANNTRLLKDSSRALAESPMLIKNTGTKMGYAIVDIPVLIFSLTRSARTITRLKMPR